MRGRSCYVRGLYTLITNLFTSELTTKYVPKKHFLTEYFHSSDNEVYPVILPAAFYDLPFDEVAEIIFVNFNSTLFGVDTPVKNKSTGQRSREILLFPRGYHIRHDDVGMVITNDLSKAFAIAAYKEPEQGERKLGILRQLWDLWTDVPRMRRTNTEGIQLLDPVTGRWRRTSESRAEEQSRMMRTSKEPFGVRGSQVLPKSSECRYYMENELRSAIQSVYTSQDYPDWRKQSVLEFSEDGEAYTRFKELTESSKSEHRHLLFLEQTAERLMVWPPLSKEERAHPAVLELRQDSILRHLESRSLSMVAFDTPHILICCQAGWPTNLFYFLAEHRKPRYPNPPIVILYPHVPNAHQWGSVGVFSDVFFVKGSPVHELDLMRGGVLQALKVVILADAGLPVDLGGIGLQDNLRYTKRPPAAYTSDVENIVVAANVQRLYGSSAAGIVLIEMQHAEGFDYLKPQHRIPLHHFVQLDLMRNKQALVHFGPPFMEGRAVSSTMLGFLMRSTFYNKKTMSIVEQLVQGGFVADEEGLSSDRQRVLDQIPVPTGYANKVYSFLFLSLLQDKGILAIGLYRVRGTLGAPTSYVLTNPPKDCIVNPDDLVYILA